MTHPLLDEKIFHDFLEMMDESALVVFEVYRSSVPGIFTKAYRAIKADDAESLCMEIHGLKSNYRQIGAMNLGDEAASIEILAKEGQTTSLLGRVRAMEAQTKELALFIDETIARLS